MFRLVHSSAIHFYCIHFSLNIMFCETYVEKHIIFWEQLSPCWSASSPFQAVYENGCPLSGCPLTSNRRVLGTGTGPLWGCWRCLLQPICAPMHVLTAPPPIQLPARGQQRMTQVPGPLVPREGEVPGFGLRCCGQQQSWPVTVSFLPPFSITLSSKSLFKNMS